MLLLFLSFFIDYRMIDHGRLMSTAGVCTSFIVITVSFHHTQLITIDLTQGRRLGLYKPIERRFCYKQFA